LLCASVCLASVKGDEKRGEREYKTAHQLADKGNIEEAIVHADRATAAVPSDVRFFSYAALLRQLRSARELSESRKLADSGKHEDAAKLLKEALERDPDNPELAAAAKANAIPMYAGKLTEVEPEAVEYEAVPELRPNDPFAKRDFHLRGTSGQVLTDFFRQYGIALAPDSSVQQRQIRLDATGADFPTALGVLMRQTHTFVVPASATQALAFNDTPENRANQEHLSMQTFAIGNAADPQTLNEIINALRAVFSLRFVGQTNSGKLAIKAPRAQLEQASDFLEQVSEPRAEVLLDIDEIEVTDSLARQLGVTVPLQYQILNIHSILLQAGVTNLNDLLTQLRSGQLGSSALQSLSGILSQLQSGTAGVISFGGGQTQGVVIVSPPPSVSFTDQKSFARVLQHTTLRASAGTNATYHDGVRYPVVTTTFSTLLNANILKGVLNGGSLVVPPPAVQYVDLGLTLKLTPLINNDGDIRLKFDMDVKNLTGQTVNQAPVLGNRQFSGTVNMRAGESAVLAGLTEDSNVLSASGLPGLTSIGLASLGGLHSRNDQRSQILITIRPHTLRLPGEKMSAAK